MFPHFFTLQFRRVYLVDNEYALEFNNSGDSINALTRKPMITNGSQDAAALQRSLEALTKRLDSLETTLQRTPVLEITVSHWPFSDQFQHLANQNLF